MQLKIIASNRARENYTAIIFVSWISKECGTISSVNNKLKFALHVLVYIVCSYVPIYIRIRNIYKFEYLVTWLLPTHHEIRKTATNYLFIKQTDIWFSRNLICKLQRKFVPMFKKLICQIWFHLYLFTFYIQIYIEKTKKEYHFIYINWIWRCKWNDKFHQVAMELITVTYITYFLSIRIYFLRNFIFVRILYIVKKNKTKFACNEAHYSGIYQMKDKFCY